MADDKKKKKGIKGFFDNVLYGKSSATALEDDLYHEDTYKSDGDFYGQADEYGEGSDADKYSSDDSENQESDGSIDSYLDNDSSSLISSIGKSRRRANGGRGEIIKLKDFTWKMYVTLIVEIILVLYTFYVLLFL